MTAREDIDGSKYRGKVVVKTEGLMFFTDSGRDLAVAIGTVAGARIKIGKAVFWNVEKVKHFMDNFSEEDQEKIRQYFEEKEKARIRRKKEKANSTSGGE